MKNNIRVVLCAPPRCSCPELEIFPIEQKCCIHDDYKGTVELTFEEMKLLVEEWSKYVN